MLDDRVGGRGAPSNCAKILTVEFKLSSPSKIAIVAALDHEINSLVADWRVSEKEFSGRTFRFFENESTVAVCGGIGSEAARRAAEAVIALYNPELTCSAGFAGAADPVLKVGDIVIPRRVVDVRDGSSTDTGIGEGVLVSFPAIADREQKAKFRDSFGAKAIDMEAAAVAKAAAIRGIRFIAVKAISDESDFALPPLDQFVGADGRFHIAKFTLFVIPRPWMWPRVLQLQRGSNAAARALCNRLQGIENEVNLDEVANGTKLLNQQ
jgi:adenosylhomocysteine nucleosidase